MSSRFDYLVALQQLCGCSDAISRLKAMVGASNFIKGDNSISFHFKMCRRANSLRIDYDDVLDEYNMVFFRGSREVKRYEGVFFDSMKELFERYTGLYLSL